MKTAIDKEKEVKKAPSNPIERIKGTVKKARDKPRKLGRLPYATGNKWIEMGRLLANPIYFFFRMIVQFEINIIFSAANSGKSLLLVQIAEDIARVEKVLIVDCELSTKQFQMRYTNLETGAVHVFPDNFLRAEIDPDLLDDVALEDAIFDSVEQAAQDGIKVICIDNLTFICTDAEKAEVTIKFMRRLIKLKKKYELTLIIVAHTPKRDPSKPITRDDLSGSSKLMALIDNALAVGLSAKDTQLRYVKTVKFRDDEFPYPAERVAVYRIDKEDCYTRFVYQGREDEQDHLRKKNQFTEMEDMQEFIDMEARQMSLREMSEETGIARSTIHRKLKKAKALGITPSIGAATEPSDVSRPTPGMGSVGQRETDVRIPFEDEED